MRVAEHSGVSFRTQATLTSPPFSAIREHAQQCESPITFDNFKILDQNRFYTDLRILESLYIYKLKPPLNNTNSVTSHLLSHVHTAQYFYIQIL